MNDRAKTQSRTCTKLALLVGSNPLPNYLAAMALKAREVVLVYTPETAEPRDRLRAVLVKKGLTVTESCIEDATDARLIRDACTKLDADHLHYSGGTKPMAAHARMTVVKEDEQASYLDERQGLLRFENGCDCQLSDMDFALTLDVLLELHGTTRNASTDTRPAPTEQDAKTLAKWILEDPSRVSLILDHFKPLDQGKRKNLPLTDAKGRPFTFEGPALSVAKVPEDGWSKKTYEHWLDFFCGTWLEMWTESVLRGCLGNTAPPIEVGVNCTRNDVPFEIDVVFVRGHRLSAISCTTDSTKGLCKSKLFEIAMRCRQMGGDLARSALVCMLDGNDSRGTFVEQLRADIASVWDAPNMPQVFGLADLREWAGIGQAPDTARLKEWLDS
jgi:hypothetical protein